MTTTPDYAGLIERLNRRGHSQSIGGNAPFNPDGPEAAAAIRALLESNAALERERDEAKHRSRVRADDNEDLRRQRNEWQARAEAAEARVLELEAKLTRAEYSAEFQMTCRIDVEAENARLRERQAEADRVIERLASYIQSPLRMSRDEDEEARRDGLIAVARDFRDGREHST